jgi:hypothetical protein
MVYGVIQPVFYFISVRKRNELGDWYLGNGTNTDWTISLLMARAYMVHFEEVIFNHLAWLREKQAQSGK